MSLLWIIPAGAAALTLAAPSARAARALALLTAAAVLAYSLTLIVPFRAQDGVLRLVELGAPGAYGIRYSVAVDGVSLALCWLTAFLTVLSLGASWAGGHGKGFWAAFLALEAAIMGVFTMQNLFWFYFFWDASLIPMFFIIGLWGSANRRKAAFKFILYTFVGGLALLVGLTGLVALHHQATGTWTWEIAELTRGTAGGPWAKYVFLAIAAGFAVKVPVFPLHNWLPDAHTEAPAAGSVMLAGAMLKMGVYGFLRVLVPAFPALSAEALPWAAGLGVASILYGALCAMAQSDLKRLIAFTSVSHMGFCVVGIFSLTPEGLSGAALQMLNHGLSTGGLFLLVGFLYERAHTRGLDDFGGLAATAPWFTFFFAFVMLSSIGLPGLNGFVGEALTLYGLLQACWPLALAASLGAVLAAAYGLPSFQRVFWAPPGPSSRSGEVSDMTLREQAILWSLAAPILGLGLFPKPLLALMAPAVAALARR
ncbi:MAG: NADH-quinone oxidoreductase subunit M [Elusimicrobia bacterium]|nr:NADH-quinone oxidoreductase subunit M [Elusimicrobiota bacterium]